eukprot:6204989-Pleurochrysis_carterae.AAC.3
MRRARVRRRALCAERSKGADGGAVAVERAREPAEQVGERGAERLWELLHGAAQLRKRVLHERHELRVLEQRRLEQADAHRVRRRLPERAVVAEAFGNEQLHNGRRAGGALRRQQQRRVEVGLGRRGGGAGARRARVGRVGLAQLEHHICALELPSPRGVVQRRERVLRRDEGRAQLDVRRLAPTPRAAIAAARIDRVRVRRTLERTLHVKQSKRSVHAGLDGKGQVEWRAGTTKWRAGRRHVRRRVWDDATQKRWTIGKE